MAQTNRGQVTSGGGRERGEGFSAERISTGTYIVTMDRNFDKLPVIVATAITSSEGEDRIANVLDSNLSSFKVTTRKAKDSDR